MVDRARLKTLSGNVLAQLVQSDELELIYAHLVSMRNFTTLRDRLAAAPPAPSAGGAPANPLVRPGTAQVLLYQSQERRRKVGTFTHEMLMKMRNHLCKNMKAIACFMSKS